MTKLDGPRVAPASGGPARQLVVLCHGYGSNGQDLIGLVPFWREALPDAAFVAPNAPEPVPLAPGGYQWFPINRMDRSELDAGVDAAAPVLEAFLDQELTRTGVSPDKLALVGFSQGTMMSLHVGLRREVAPAGILGYSGVLPAPERLKSEIRSRPPVLLIHGDLDPMIPVAALHTSVRVLGEAGVDVRWHVSRGVPHSIGQDGVDLGREFLSACLAGEDGSVTNG